VFRSINEAAANGAPVQPVGAAADGDARQSG
jgi:hypothetical protein